MVLGTGKIHNLKDILGSQLVPLQWLGDGEKVRDDEKEGINIYNTNICTDIMLIP